MSTQDAYEAAREAAVERAMAVWPTLDNLFLTTEEFVRRLLDAALAVPECPDCGGATRWQCSGCRKRFDGDLMAICPNCHREGYWTGSVKPCPSCGSGQSRVRVAVVEQVTDETPLMVASTEVGPFQRHAFSEPVFRALAPTPEAEKETP